jgi:CTP synthase
VISAPDVSVIYELPIALHAEKIDEQITEKLNIWSRPPDLAAWHRMVDLMKHPPCGAVTIALVGKYVHLRDAYKSLHEALAHGGIANGCRIEVRYIDSEGIDASNVERELGNVDGILVPGGFGGRGAEGKIHAIRHARERGIPFFGICLGMQMAVVEFARHVAGLPGANSTEFDPTAPHPVIDLMPDQRGVKAMGGTMRLGAYRCVLVPGSLASEIYGSLEISERHRHRYEFNNDYRRRLEEAGMIMSGHSPDLGLVEIIELPNHPYFIGCQFHPEFKSRPQVPHPLFTRFVRAALQRRDALRAQREVRSELGGDPAASKFVH